MADKKTAGNFDGSLDALMIEEIDNVAVCLHDVAADTEIAVRLGKENFAVKALDAIPRGHKIAVREIADGETIVKYGEVIGRATAGIGLGKHVHLHNVTD